MSTKRSSPLRVAVLASGRGSNLQAIIDAIEAGQVQAQIVAVISNKKDAVALERARKHGLPDLFVDPKPFAGQPDSREAYDRALLEVLQQRNVELVLLAGYMKIVTAVLVNAFANRMMNIHPSLLPSFPGLEVQKKAIDWGCKLAGCTVHFVTEGVDEGPIIFKRPFRSSIAIRRKRWPLAFSSRSTRSIRERCSSLPKVVLRVDGRRVLIDGGKPDGDAIISPS